ncbi:MAG: hypothetical protein FWD06_04965 [Oscillospiraceae bacterium]|nr:hypothetical protein [Oscillospiraceae bacterium]
MSWHEAQCTACRATNQFAADEAKIICRFCGAETLAHAPEPNDVLKSLLKESFDFSKLSRAKVIAFAAGIVALAASFRLLAMIDMPPSVRDWIEILFILLGFPAWCLLFFLTAKRVARFIKQFIRQLFVGYVVIVLLFAFVIIHG